MLCNFLIKCKCRSFVTTTPNSALVWRKNKYLYFAQSSLSYGEKTEENPLAHSYPALHVFWRSNKLDGLATYIYTPKQMALLTEVKYMNIASRLFIAVFNLSIKSDIDAPPNWRVSLVYKLILQTNK